MAKRENGTGSIQVRGTRFIAALTVHNAEKGGQKRLTRSFRTREAAEQWLQDQLRTPEVVEEVGMQLHPNLNANCTYAQFLDVWLELRKPQVRQKTWLEYERLIRIHLKPNPLTDLALSRISALHVERFLLALFSSGGTAPLAFMALRLVKLSLGHAVDWGLLTFHPAARVRSPRRSLQELIHWSAEDIRVFLAVCLSRQPRWHVLFRLALTTGLRRGELLGLHWTDIDFENGVLHVRHSLVQAGSKAVLNEPKTRAAQRKVTLSPDALELLKTHQQRQKDEGSHWKSRSPQETGLVFPSTVGRFQLPCTLLKIFKRLMEQAQVPRIRFHDLRHTAATLLVRKGVPIKVVADRLGHQDASLTLRVYTHVYEEQRREATYNLTDLLKP